MRWRISDRPWSRPTCSKNLMLRFVEVSSVWGRNGTPIQQALERFDAAIRIGTPPSALQLLNPGVNSDLVRNGLASRALPTSAELEALYGWHNGTNAGPGVLLGSMWLLPGFYLLSLDEAISDYDTFKSDARWNLRHFPASPL